MKTRRVLVAAAGVIAVASLQGCATSVSRDATQREMYSSPVLVTGSRIRQYVGPAEIEPRAAHSLHVVTPAGLGDVPGLTIRGRL